MSKFLREKNVKKESVLTGSTEAFNASIDGIVELAEKCRNATNAEDVLNGATDIIELVRIMTSSKDFSGDAVIQNLNSRVSELGAITRYKA